MTTPLNFRQRLDTVLRTLDVRQVSDFLIAEGQWDVGTPVDPERAMWMMIAGSPTLRDLHARARTWLVAHGHEEDAQAVLGKAGKQAGSSAKGGQPGRPRGQQPQRGARKQPGSREKRV